MGRWGGISQGQTDGLGPQICLSPFAQTPSCARVWGIKAMGVLRVDVIRCFIDTYDLIAKD